MKVEDSFEDFRILGECGQGAFGKVYLAQDLSGRKLALKIITQSPAGERELKGLRYYHTLADLHPNLVRICHIGAADSLYYYTMEAADNLAPEGEPYRPATLANILAERGHLPAQEVLKLGRELLSGLEYLNAHRLIHRDIKPSNIMLVNGVAKLTDVGLVADFDHSVSMAGTIGFLPPELYEGTGIADCRSDLYSLGKVLYCALTGLPPQQYPLIPARLPLSACRQIRPILERACCRNPQNRYRSATEFLGALPETLRPAGPLERRLECFRSWSRQHPAARHAIRIALLSAIVLPIVAGAIHATAAWQLRSARQHRLEQVDRFSESLGEQREMIERSLRLWAPETLEPVESELSKFDDARTHSRWEEARKSAATLAATLGSIAERQQQSLISQQVTPQEKELNALLAKFAEFEESPLFSLLSDRKRDDFLSIRNGHRARLAAIWDGPASGSNWCFSQAPDLDFVFVAGGGFLFGPRKEFRNQPHFWMARAEVTNDRYRAYTGSMPSLNSDPACPVNRVSWRGIMRFCRAITTEYRERGLLPEGYIVRPPTEQEWEYAASGGWRGAPPEITKGSGILDYGWFKENAFDNPRPVTGRQPNRLGISDLFGNISEITLPSRKVLPNLLIERGGSFHENQVGLYWNSFFLFNQSYLYWCGFRLAIAPGEFAFFDDMWLSGKEWSADIDGKHYELFGGNAGTFLATQAAAEAQFLGGRLGELDTRKLFLELRRAIPFLGRYPVYLGAERDESGTWRWNSSRRAIDHGQWHLSASNRKLQHLFLDGEQWKAVGDTNLPLYLCEWSAEEWAKRTSFARSDAPSQVKVKFFSAGGRRFLLARSRALWYVKRRYAEIVGGRLAVLDTPEIREAVLREVAPFDDTPIALGGELRYDRWIWLNGKPVENPPGCDTPDQRARYGDSDLVILNGKLSWSNTSGLLLIEWPEK